MLTRTDENGNWCLNGVEFAEIRAGCTLSRKAADTIYAAICKLKDYEDTGLDPDEADRLSDENEELTEIAQSCIEQYKWHPASELPRECKDVLVITMSKNGSRNIDKGYVCDGRWVHRGVAEVTHWMPLPSLPEEE